MLVDGVPLVRADFGTASWQHLPLDQIERIEIVRGNLSALYGAQAIGGVVQILTRRAERPQASVAIGSQGTQRPPRRPAARLAARARGCRRRCRGSASDGYSARDAGVDPGANPDRDGARQIRRQRAS